MRSCGSTSPKSRALPLLIRPSTFPFHVSALIFLLRCSSHLRMAGGKHIHQKPIPSARQIEIFDSRYHPDGCRRASWSDCFRGWENRCYKQQCPLLKVTAFSMSDKFEDIRIFVAVIQARGFAQAGKRLGIAKSAISRRVNDLENRLGARLLNRTTRQISPTPAGAELYQRGLQLLADFQEAEDAVSSGSVEPTGKLRISRRSRSDRIAWVRSFPNSRAASPASRSNSSWKIA